MSHHRLRVQGRPDVLPAILGSHTVAVGETYTPVEGVTIRIDQMPLERKGWPPADVIFDFVLEVTAKGAGVTFAGHLFKVGGGKVRKWLDGRTLETEEDILEVLRRAQGDDGPAGGMADELAEP